MNRRTIAVWTLVLGFIALSPRAGNAQIWAPDQECSSGTFTVCVDFDLTYNELEDYYYFTVTYASSDGDPTGFLTGAGLYDYNGGNDWDFSNVTMVSPDDQSWVINGGNDDEDCEELSGGGNVLFEGCVSKMGNPSQGVSVDNSLVFKFQSAQEINPSDFEWANGGELGGRAFIRGVGDEDCSYKLDSPQGFVSGCGAEVVPEPMTVILLATGLVGIGAVGYRNRRKEEEEV